MPSTPGAWYAEWESDPMPLSLSTFRIWPSSEPRGISCKPAARIDASVSGVERRSSAEFDSQPAIKRSPSATVTVDRYTHHGYRLRSSRMSRVLSLCRRPASLPRKAADRSSYHHLRHPPLRRVDMAWSISALG